MVSSNGSTTLLIAGNGCTLLFLFRLAFWFFASDLLLLTNLQISYSLSPTEHCLSVNTLKFLPGYVETRDPSVAMVARGKCPRPLAPFLYQADVWKSVWLVTCFTHPGLWSIFAVHTILLYKMYVHSILNTVSITTSWNGNLFFAISKES